MDKNNDFDGKERNYPSDLNEYVSREIMEYYGEDIVHRAAREDSPALKRRKISRYRSTVGVVCSVMFLIGAMIFSGVVFTSGIPIVKRELSDSSAEIYSETADDPSVISERSTESDNADVTHSQKTSDSEKNTESENIITTDTEKTSDSEKNTESENIITTDTEKTSDSEKNTESENIITTDTETLSSSDEVTDIFESRPEYYSLPEIPDEGLMSEVPTDIDNNEFTNPNDNVTTGRRIRASIGIFLMIMSLVIAFLLNKIRCED